ncbi:hypothetical protein J437_LFUL017993, partial [Ladona fulva]
TLCTEDDWRKTAKDFEVYWNYPHCIGACDGKHIMIQNPKNSGSCHVLNHFPSLHEARMPEEKAGVSDDDLREFCDHLDKLH